MATTTATTAAPVTDGGGEQKKRVSRPNREEFQKQLDQLDQKLKDQEKAVEKARAEVNNAQGGGPKNDEQKKLRSELDELKKKQADLKTNRNKIFSEIKTIDEQVNKKIKDIQASKSKVSYKSVEDIDKEIKRLEKEVDSGSLKLVEEKKILTEISNLKKAKKSFPAFAETQKSIDEDKAKIQTLRSQLDNYNGKAISDRFNEVQAELEKLRSQQQKDYKSKNVLYENRASAEKSRDEIRTQIRKLKDDFFAQKRAFDEQQKIDQAARVEREKAERAAAEKEKKKHDAEEKLEAAKEPAYASQIHLAESLLEYFDPEYKRESPTNKFNSVSASVNKTSNSRQVESIPAGAQIVKKNEEAFFAGSGGKKNKKKAKESDKVSMNLSIIEGLGSLNITVPTSKGEIPNTIQSIKEKIEYYKENQDRVTAEKVERAKAELAKLQDEEEKQSDPAKPESQQQPVEASA